MYNNCNFIVHIYIKIIIVLSFEMNIIWTITLSYYFEYNYGSQKFSTNLIHRNCLYVYSYQTLAYLHARLLHHFFLSQH